MPQTPMETPLEKHWHHVSAHEVTELLGCQLETGLTAQDVTERQARFGPNQLTPKKPQSAAIRFLLQFHQPLIYILLVAAGITALLQEWVDAGVIFGVVLLASGDKVPADLRLLKVRDLQIDESALTGESVPVAKQTGQFPQETPLADRANMAYVWLATFLYLLRGHESALPQCTTSVGCLGTNPSCGTGSIPHHRHRKMVETRFHCWNRSSISPTHTVK